MIGSGDHGREEVLKPSAQSEGQVGDGVLRNFRNLVLGSNGPNGRTQERGVEGGFRRLLPSAVVEGPVGLRLVMTAVERLFLGLARDEQA
jgi:hypothetical protein